MASDTLALDLAFAPQQRGGASPLNMALASMLQNQNQSRSDTAQAARQERALAAQIALQQEVGKQATERQIALENLDAKNRAEAVAMADKGRRDAAVQAAQAASAATGKPFNLKDGLTTAEQEAQAKLFTSKVSADVYKQMSRQAADRKKEIEELEAKIMEPATVNMASVYRAAAGRPEIMALLKPADRAKLASGNFDSSNADPIVAGAIESVRKEFEDAAYKQKAFQNEILKGRQRESQGRYDSLNLQLRKVGEGVNPWDLYEMPVEGPSSPFAEEAGLANASARPPIASIAPGQAASALYPDESMPDAGSVAPAVIPSPQMQGLIPDAARFIGPVASNAASGVSAIAPDVGPVLGLAGNALGGLVGETGDFLGNVRRSLFRGANESEVGPVSPLVTNAKAAGVGDPLSAYLTLLTEGMHSVAEPIRDTLHGLSYLALPYLQPPTTPLPFPRGVIDRGRTLGIPAGREFALPTE